MLLHVHESVEVKLIMAWHVKFNTTDRKRTNIMNIKHQPAEMYSKQD